MELKTQLENLVSVMGCILDEWRKGEEILADKNITLEDKIKMLESKEYQSCTIEEFSSLYDDATKILTKFEEDYE